MQVIDLKLSGLKLIQPCLFQDERGFFFESYQKARLSDQGIEPCFIQDNDSYSCKNTIRGLHFQSEPGQAKLVRCVQGKIWDVAVDLRPYSPTFMQWEAVELDDVSHAQLFIPVGFAHGFCVLSDGARVHYKVSSFYNPHTECTVRWNDPAVGVNWPIKTPLLSPRDQISPFFQEMAHVLDYRK